MSKAIAQLLAMLALLFASDWWVSASDRSGRWRPRRQSSLPGLAKDLLQLPPERRQIHPEKLRTFRTADDVLGNGAEHQLTKASVMLGALIQFIPRFAFRLPMVLARV
ncbi:MAG: hypothetical protein AB7O66_26150, partial [Limisphaerales bacterium]